MTRRKGGPERPHGYERQYRDRYVPDLDPGEMAACAECHAVFRRRHWFFDAELYRELTRRSQAREVTCPACRKVRDRYFEGEVTLASGEFLRAHKEEILNFVRNQDERARGLNPLERVVAIEQEDGRMVVTTTNEKLAQRIGRELRKAFQGTTTYRWSENNRCLRVTWARE